MKLYSYWRSGTSHRVRIALNLKNIECNQVPVNLRAWAHKEPEFLKLNPQGLLPLIVLDDGRTLSQSPAILEYLEETHPDVPLLPSDPFARGKVRALAAVIGCDTHPLNNMRVLKYLTDELHTTQEDKKAWISHWTVEAFGALEHLLREQETQGSFMWGDSPTLADCYLVPQIYSAERFGINIAKFKRLQSINEACNRLEAFQKADPAAQEDAE